MISSNGLHEVWNIEECIYLDSNGVELRVGDVFEYTSKKWKSKAKIRERDGKLCVIVTQRDMPDKIVPLRKFLDKHYVVKISNQ